MTGDSSFPRVHNDLRILLLDMEISYAVYYAFPSKREQYLSPKNIKHPQFCICAAWKWHNEVSIYSIKITDDHRTFKKDFRNDFIIAKKLHEVMSEADIIVAHNGDAFDIKHANTLFIKHGLGPIPEKKSIDTLKVARRYFNFAGNDLDTLSKRFGGDGKIDKPDWILLTDGDEEEIYKATTYCISDVNELERVFVNIRPYIRNMPHMKKIGDITECHACRSKLFHRKGTAFDGIKQYIRIKCNDCGHEMKQRIKI